MSTAIEHGTNYLTNHNVSTIVELRTLSMEDLLVDSQDRVGNESIWWVTALSGGYPLIFKLVLDNYVLPEKYTETLHNGQANDVPVITGNAKDESGASPSTDCTVAYCTLKYDNLSSRTSSSTRITGTRPSRTRRGTLLLRTPPSSACGRTPRTGTRRLPPPFILTTGFMLRLARTRARSTSRRLCMHSTLSMLKPKPILHGTGL